jgi:protein-S-isoprenylcysteine O-methyltransferase Ste14
MHDQRPEGEEMQNEGLIVLLINFAAIGLLPVYFFSKDGKFNIMWWATAVPFFTSIAAVVAANFGWITPAITSPVSCAIAIILSTLSIALIAFTLGTHRIPIALWHQSNDAPKHIVTWGAYSRIRHPFYASFLMAFLAAILYCPHIITVGCFVYGAILLNLTAAREEQRLSNSEFGNEYQAYMTQTGRFLPRWSKQ